MCCFGRLWGSAPVTRDGADHGALLTNLPREGPNLTDASQIASLYWDRRKSETAFPELAMHLRLGIDTLDYPKAAVPS
jgi:uncharacterized membrane-anchored protein